MGFRRAIALSSMLTTLSAPVLVLSGGLLLERLFCSAPPRWFGGAWLGWADELDVRKLGGHLDHMSGQGPTFMVSRVRKMIVGCGAHFSDILPEFPDTDIKFQMAAKPRHNLHAHTFSWCRTKCMFTKVDNHSFQNF